MTPKQRAKIYRKAAEGIDSGKWIFCCEALANIKTGNWYEDPTEHDFPELFMFKPKSYGYSWWDYDNEPRILALLLCEQIALSTPS